MKSLHQEATRLLANNDFDAAEALCAQMLEGWPAAWQPHVLRTRISMGRNDGCASQDNLLAARESGAPPLPVGRLEFVIARLQQDHDRQAAALAHLVEIDPGNKQWPRAGLRIKATRALALAESGNDAAAWRELVDAARCAPGEAFPGGLDQQLESWIDAQPDGIPTLERLVESNPHCASLLWTLAILLDSTGEPVRARALVKAHWSWARSANPPARLCLWNHLDLGDAATSSPDGSPLRFNALLRENRFRDAGACLPVWKPLLEEASRLIDDGNAPVPIHGTGAMVVSSVGRSAGTVLVFPGLRDQAGLPNHVIDVFLCELGLRAIYFQDARRLGYLGGLDGLGDSFDETARALQRHLDIDETPVFTLGISGGGVAALAYAQALGAKGTLAFSPPSTLDQERLAAMGDTRARAWARRFNANVDAERFDGPTILARTPDAFRMTIYAGAGNREDRAHAERYSPDPRAIVHLIDGLADHNSMAPAAAIRGFLNLCSEAWLA